MTDRPTRADRRRAAIVGVVIVAAALLDWVDASRGGPAAQPLARAAVFGFVVSALEFVWSWLGAVAEITATYLATVVAWIAQRLAQLFVSTGAVFARVWDGLKIVWSDVLKPALQWVDTWVKRIHRWLVDTFRPVFDYLKELRQRIQDFYDKWLRPITDTIDFIRQVNAVLLQFHITFLDGLSRLLTDLERRIQEPIVWLIQQLTRVQNALDLIVDGFGFFQRYTMVASLRKHLPHWIGFFWSDQVGPVRGRDGSAERTAEYPPHDWQKDRVVMTQYFRSGDGEAAGRINELALMLMNVAEGTAGNDLAEPL